MRFELRSTRFKVAPFQVAPIPPEGWHSVNCPARDSRPDDWSSSRFPETLRLPRRGSDPPEGAIPDRRILTSLQIHRSWPIVGRSETQGDFRDTSQWRRG
jgi:hypothetical protein